MRKFFTQAWEECSAEDAYYIVELEEQPDGTVAQKVYVRNNDEEDVAEVTMEIDVSGREKDRRYGNT